MIARRPHLRSALVMGLVFIAGSAAAEPPRPSPASGKAASSGSTPTAPPPKLTLDGPDPEARERAQALFEKGVAAYREGRSYEAVEIFLETNRVYPNPQLLFNV